MKKGKEVQRELEMITGSHTDLVIADYSMQDQIRIVAADLIARYTRLDVLINNVGTYQKTRHVTLDRTEMTFAVNYLGPFLLTHLLLPLLPLLKKSPGARIVTVAPSAHEDVDRIHGEDLPGDNGTIPGVPTRSRSLRILPSRIPLPGISRGPGKP